MITSKEKPDKKTKEAWLNDPANWRDEILYYNPKDNRWFPPKRYGGGWTVNWAKRNSIIAFVVLVLVVTGTGIFIKFLFNL